MTERAVLQPPGRDDGEWISVTCWNDACDEIVVRVPGFATEALAKAFGADCRLTYVQRQLTLVANGWAPLRIDDGDVEFWRLRVDPETLFAARESRLRTSIAEFFSSYDSRTLGSLAYGATHVGESEPDKVPCLPAWLSSAELTALRDAAMGHNEELAAETRGIKAAGSTGERAMRR